MRARFASVCLVVGLSGCGAKQEAKAPALQPVTAVAPVVEEPPDLSPVKQPDEVVVVGRIARPRAFVETLTRYSSLPFRVEDLIPAEAKPLAGAVLWEAPIEMLVALDAFGEGKVPPPLVVGSVGLESLDAALSAADAMQMPTRKVAPGIYRVGDFSETSCAVAVSLGAAPARLICGRGSKSVDALLPYATRGLPNEAQTGADFELTLDAKPVQARYGHDVGALRLLAGVGINQIALDSARFDRALSDAVYGLVDETLNLFNDLDQLRFEARLDTQRSVLTAASELRLKGSSSWVAGTIAAIQPKSVPESLPRLPPDATLAAYNTALPAERYAPISRIAGELGEGFLEHEKLPAATRKRLRRLTDAWLGMPEGFMFAMGPSGGDTRAHPDTLLMRVEEPPARLLGLYSDLFGLLGDPALKQWVRKKLDLKITDKMWPKLTKKPMKLAGFKQPATLFEMSLDLKTWSSLDDKLVRNLKELLDSDGDQLKRLDVLVQPDGEATYVITGDDPKEMARVMAEHLKKEPGIPLAKPARAQQVAMAGFVTLAYVAHTLERSAKSSDKSRELGKALAAAPTRGKAPIPFATTVGPGSARVDVEIPAAVFSDLSAAIVAAAPALKK